MRRLSEWNRSRSAALVSCGGIFVLMLVLNILTPYICDDFTYRLNFATGEALDSLLQIPQSMYAHSFVMNGRLVSHALAQVFMLLPPVVFDVCNAAVFTLTIYLAVRLCAGERSGALLVLTFCLLWSRMPVFGQVALWQVGAINYFWSLTGLILFIAPALLRFTEGRELLPSLWHRVGFCVYGFFFGWYNEIASFVGMCMVVCLVILDVWMERRKIAFYSLLPVLCAALGYLIMLSMPAQAANKTAALTIPVLLRRFVVCGGMLVKHLLPLLIPLMLVLILGFRTLPRKTVVLSGLFALAGVCANFMPIAASYYPERCLCTSVLMLLMALLFPLSAFKEGRSFRNLSLICVLILCLTLPQGLSGCRDIVSCHRQHVRREQTIAAALQKGERDVVANTVIPETPFSGYYDLRDLMEDPDTWPNHSMALYYGLDSIRCK